jgi:hypothetical protein
MINVRISAEKWSELSVNDPGNLRVGMRFTKQRNRWKHMNDVTERARPDD